MVNWKTKLPAIGSLLAVIGGFLHSPSTFNYAINLPIVLAALGVLFAKQHNVTGGDVQQ